MVCFVLVSIVQIYKKPEILRFAQNDKTIVILRSRRRRRICSRKYSTLEWEGEPDGTVIGGAAQVAGAGIGAEGLGAGMTGIRGLEEGGL